MGDIKKYNNTFLEGEVIDLSDKIVLVDPVDTPLYTLLAGRGQIVSAKDITVTWRQKSLNPQRGTLKLEGAEAGEGINSTRTMKSNICQILEKVTKVSGTVRALAAKGIGDEFLQEIEDRMIELKRDNEWYFLNGTKTYEDEATNTPRQMDGLLNLVDNVIDLSDGDGKLTEEHILDVMQDIWNAGAQGQYFAFVNATEKRIINKLLADGKNTRLIAEAGENMLGVKVNGVDTDFGTVYFVLNRHMPNGQILFVDLDLVEIAQLRAPFYEDLAKTGDYSKGHVLAENTIKLLNTKAGGKIVGITG